MKSMRDFIELAEKEGELKRITAEVDWNLELSHIAKLNEEAQGPALLFENVKDYDTPLDIRHKPDRKQQVSLQGAS